MTYNRGCYNRRSVDNLHPIGSCNMHYSRPERTAYTERCDCSDNVEMNYRLAMVYSSVQEWQNIYGGEKALETGTIFAELDKPFKGYKYTKGVCAL